MARFWCDDELACDVDARHDRYALPQFRLEEKDPNRNDPRPHIRFPTCNKFYLLEVGHSMSHT